jgi:hypothetical protein
VSIEAWLAARRPVPPPALAARVGELIGRSRGDGSDPASTCLVAAATALDRLVRERDAGRSSALDLLAIDALVTYAFEAAADAPESIDERAHDAMVSLSTVANR